MLKFAVIIGSTRDSRIGPVPAQWFMDEAKKRTDMSVELVDLKSFNLPLFNEKASNAWAPSQDSHAVAWQKKIAEFDGYIAVTAEYNRSVTGALKNAFDQAYVEWKNKPIGFVGYGGVGAARAVEHARLIAIELQMVPVRSAVHIAGGDFMHLMQKHQLSAEAQANLVPGAKALMDEMVWWGNATKAARAKV